MAFRMFFLLKKKGKADFSFTFIDIWRK
jgi:hypothetical protein